MSHSVHRSSNSRFFEISDEFSDAELIKLVTGLKHEIKVLQLENEILEKTIMRLEPSLLQGLQQAFEYAVKLQSSSSMHLGSFVRSKTSTVGMLEAASNASKMLASPSRVSTRKVESSARLGGTIIFGLGPRINVLERSELVSTEMELLINVLEKAKKKAAKEHALLKAQLEEIGIREIDFEKASEAFHQQVIVEGWDKIAQRIPAEIWIRFMTEWVKMCDRQIGKLRLRTSTLNTQHSKLTGQIRVKTELSESLQPVDFEKMQIVNDESQAIIEQKCAQLVELKKMTGDANLNLTIHKKAMWEQNTYLSNILRTIKNRQRQRKELMKEKDVIKVQADSLSERLEKVKKARMAYEVPDIMNYVMVKAEITDLKHSIKVLENRVHIQEIAITSLNKKLHSMLMYPSMMNHH